MLKIGTFPLRLPYILAPMAGITDVPFRMLNRRFGCECAFVEMINVRSVSYKSVKTRRMLESCPGDRPLGVQILGCEPLYIAKALDVLSRYHFDILDFNAACPERKVIRRGEGASLLREPERLFQLLKLVVSRAWLPVTVKIRAGWDRHSINCGDVARRAEQAGVSAIFIHGRSREQGYTGTVDYSAIQAVKKAVSIPVIGSGDVFSAALAQKMFEETGCDAVLVARGALGNPWIFQELLAAEGKGEFLKPARDEISSVIREHLDSYIGYYGARNGVIIFRKFFSWYTAGFRNVRSLRERSSSAKTPEHMYALIEEFSTHH